MISMLTISIFTYIVYMLANKILAVQMHIKFLVLCAFCAFSISLILPRLFVGFAGLTGTLCIVLLFGLISSYFIARYYDAELRKAPLKSPLATNSVANSMEISEMIESIYQEPLQPSPPAALSLENVLKNTQEPTENLKSITESMIKEYFYPVQYQDEGWKLIKVETIVQLPTLETIPAPTEVSVKEYFYPITYKEGVITSFLKELANTNHEKKEYSYPVKYDEGIIVSFLEKLANAEQQERVEEIEEVPVEKNEEVEVVNDLMDVRKEENEMEYEEEIALQEENVTTALSDLTTTTEELDLSSVDLDTLMDVAFSHKEQRNFLQALTTFRQALFLYPDSEAAPFLVVEIGTILKNLGSYNEAIQVFTEGRLLPGVIHNTSLDQEFISNIAYLRVVKNVLIKNSLEFTPLNQIPSSAFKEINDEFSEWRSQS